ncbi:MAG: symmetrical bis(5'-nucleosyl)-tetraphosphatase [Legionellaceae bacterium]|nr:symmetrical bis(5'-nucleosyl)-tetraphosphatase [Legionellaceae bacterium]
MSLTYAIKQHKGFDYAIGDVQGCYAGLQSLLEKIDFNEHDDRLWFVGDLVNRGPESLDVLRFIKNLPVKPVITLGNHDLYLISLIFAPEKAPSKKDTLGKILKADDCEELGDWLRKQKIIHFDERLNVVMSHAGIPPIWSLDKALNLGSELEQALSGIDFRSFLDEMMGDSPDVWSDNLVGNSRLRLICNYFTRMRFCRTIDGGLVLKQKGGVDKIPPNLSPWYALPNRIEIQPDIVFGHWAALNGISPNPNIHAIDTGFIWGGSMTALRLQDKQRISVSS